MSLDFTAIDFETANRQRASVCSVGMARVRGGQVVESVSWFIQPPTGIDSFEPENIRIHGIKPADVADADDWAASLARIAAFAGSDRLVAYYAPFDKSVFRRSAEAIGASVTGDEWSCAWALVKRHLELDLYKLPVVAGELGIEGLNHHDAESDALVCAQIVLELAARAGVGTLDELWPAVEGGGRSRFYSSKYSVKKADLPTPNPDANPHHPFYGQAITVTGDFAKYSRMEAFDLAADLGASIEMSTTLKTSILVVCGEDPHASGFDLSAGSGKQKKAHQFITERGKQIAVLSEDDFYRMAGV